MDIINKLTELFTDFPTVGKRTAGRFVFYLMKLPNEKIEELITSIKELKRKIKFCAFCFNPHGSQNLFCPICEAANRNKNILCLIEKETDLISIENTKRYNGIYFILAKNPVSIRKIGEQILRIPELLERIKNPQKFEAGFQKFSEIIIATNPTPEGRTVSILVERALRELAQPLGFKITHLAQGLPVGGELEYADEETLQSAFEGRK